MKNISEEQWQQQVKSSQNPVFVDFWAAWCGPCRMVSPIVEQLEKEYQGNMDFVKVDVDQNKKLAQEYNISSIPTLAILHKGKIISQRVGVASKESLKNWIEVNLSGVHFA